MRRTIIKTGGEGVGRVRTVNVYVLEARTRGEPVLEERSWVRQDLRRSVDGDRAERRTLYCSPWPQKEVIVLRGAAGCQGAAGLRLREPAVSMETGDAAAIVGRSGVAE